MRLNAESVIAKRRLTKKAIRLKVRYGSALKLGEDACQPTKIKSMKLSNVILSCALAAGLMTFAADKVQAGDVVGGTLFAPVKVKAILTYVDENGKHQKMSFSNKDILANSGYGDKGNRLVMGPGTGTDFFVINKQAGVVVANLNEEGFVYTVEATDDTDTYKESLNSYKATKQGHYDVYFWDTPSGPGNAVNISGDYSASDKEKYNSSNSAYKKAVSFKTQKALARAYHWDGEAESNQMQGNGSISSKGGGKLDAIK